MIRQYILALLVCTALCGCYNSGNRNATPPILQNEQVNDSISPRPKRLYSISYNFVVKAQTLTLFKQQPEEIVNCLPVDTIMLHRNDNIAVMDIRVVSDSSNDSIWVQVARDGYTFGWTKENALLMSVVPDDPISQFISIFSDVHVLVTIIIICVVFIIYMVHYVFKRNVKMVHFNDIDSFYPSLLAIISAFSAIFYSSLQLFVPALWQHFYYYPTLNPFSLPIVLSLFIISVWAMIIVAVAAVDEVFHKLSFGEALLYIGSLVSVCAAIYIVFSITTLYYIGYLLFVAYTYFAVRRHIKRENKYICGNCGTAMSTKGKCPKCGATNL